MDRGRGVLGRVVLAAVPLIGLVAGVTSPAAARSDTAAIAAANGRSEAEVRRILADPTSRVGRNHRLFYVDRGPPPAAAPAPGPALAAAPVPPPFPYDQTLLLHSRPGSKRVIFLDFDGHHVEGTAWNDAAQFGTPPSFDVEEFSKDGAAGFGDGDRDIIQSVWQRVAEDYAIFDVDVTTQDPGQPAITRTDVSDLTFGTRAVITNTTGPIYSSCGCGGMGFLGVFDAPTPTFSAPHDEYQPAFVFNQAQASNPKYIADAVSHEVGHNLDLDHDGTVATATSPPSEYYPGHGDWGPIMGDPFLHPVTQWSKGDYTAASNTQKDLTVIAAHGAALLPDDHGDSEAAATTVAPGTAFTEQATVTTDADVDVFRVVAAAGAATFSVAPAAPSPNLDVRLELRDGTDAVLASADPPSTQQSADQATGLGAAISVNLPTGGSYYLFVSGVGFGSAATGYTGYASVGRYVLAGMVPQGAASDVALTSSSNPSVSGDPVTFGATVTPRSGVDTPTGTVTFSDGASTLCADVALSAGHASCAVALTTGTHPVTAVYGGSATFSGATSPTLTQTVDAPPAPPPPPPPPPRSGYLMATDAGQVFAFGDVTSHGDGGSGTVDIEPTPSGDGYWLVDANGTVRAFGDAVSRGQVAGGILTAGERITSLSRTPSGNGYWIFSSRGRVLAFGDAPHVGDALGLSLNGPILDSVPTPTGRGYYMVASDGGIFAYGDASFFGSMGGRRLNAPVQSLVPDPDGAGYWLVASDGGVFAFEAGFRGSMGGTRLNRPVTGMVAFGNGYLMVGEDGGIFNFSDKAFFGSLGANPPASPVVAVASIG